VRAGLADCGRVEDGERLLEAVPEDAPEWFTKAERLIASGKLADALLALSLALRR
jgi:hypothetical protein